MANASQPSGRLIKQWQAANAPTIVAPSCKCKPGQTNRNHECVERDCSVCSPGNLSDDGIRGANQSWPGMANLRGWRYEATAQTLSIQAQPQAAGAPDGARAERLCLDLRGQLPGGLNMQHLLPCDGSGAQRWVLNSSSGQLRSANDTTQCLQGAEWWTWLGRPLIITGGCQLNTTTWQAPTTQRWELSPQHGALTNAAFGCVGVSYDSGPPSTIWAKPLEGGRTALLVVNGADLEQRVDLIWPTFSARDTAHGMRCAMCGRGGTRPGRWAPYRRQSRPTTACFWCCAKAGMGRETASLGRLINLREGSARCV